MDGYQMNAANVWNKRWLARVVGLVILMAFAWVLATSHFGNEYLSPRAFAGCYVSPNADPLLLSPSGTLQSRKMRVGAFKVLAPVGGKHGPLVEATGLDVVQRKGRVAFAPGSGSFFWPVTDHALGVAFAPNSNLQFVKGPDAVCL